MIPRYKEKKIEAIFSDYSKYQRWIKIELAYLKYLNKIGKISKQTIAYLTENMRVDLQLISKIEKEINHDVFAFLNSFNHLDKKHSKYIHFGLTSTDIVDTANSMAIAAVALIIQDKIEDIQQILKEISFKYMHLPCVARTHGMHAEPYSFGLRFALFFEEMERRLRTYKRAKEAIKIIKISGSTGIFAHFQPEVEAFMANELGLNPSGATTQVISRDIYAEYFSSLGLLALSIARFAFQLRLLTLEEIDEVREGFTNQQRGSSSMPHKKNPITLENISGMCRFIHGLVGVSDNNISLFFERDISHSCNERILLLDVHSGILRVLKNLEKVLKNLTINKEKIAENLNKSGVKIYSQCLLLKITEKTNKTRLQSYELIKQILDNSCNGLKKQDLFNSKITNYLDLKDINYCLDNTNYLKNVGAIYKRIFGPKEE